jgi:hypothetical protein
MADYEALYSTFHNTTFTSPLSYTSHKSPFTRSSQQLVPRYNPAPSWIGLGRHERQADDGHESLAWGPNNRSPSLLLILVTPALHQRSKMILSLFGLTNIVINLLDPTNLTSCYNWQCLATSGTTKNSPEDVSDVEVAITT